MNMTRKNKIIIASCLLIAMFISIFGSSLAYFTDNIVNSTSGTTGTVQVSIDDNINMLNQYGQDILNPGDIRTINFTLNNDGNKSIDTDVILTLTTDRKLSNNSGSKTVQDKVVYKSEYELYHAEDVEFIEGYGHYPKAGARPVEVRYFVADNQIKYVIPANVLSGNLDMDEHETEYRLVDDYVYGTSDKYVLKEYDDYVNYDAILGDDVPGVENFAAIWLDKDVEYESIIIPNSGAIYSPNFIGEDFDVKVEALLFTIDSSYGCGISESIKEMYIGSSVKYIIVDNYDIDEYPVYTVEEFAEVYGITIHRYNNINDVINGVQTYISEEDYNALSDEEKANYVQCTDSQEYDLVLLFDPHSGNDFQNSSVSVQVEAKAKQHRNTEMGWELVGELLDSSIDQSVFTVEYNKYGEVEITGTQRGVDLESMTEVVIPEGVEVIPQAFFYRNFNITKVTLPSTIKRIEYAAFADNTSLAEINLPEGLEYIGQMAFYDTIISAEIPSTVTYIGEEAFAYTKYTTLNIPESVEYIGPYAFRGINGLNTIVIPDSVEFIGDKAFETYSFETVNTTVYADSAVVKGYDWASDNRPVTILPYDQT